MMTTDLFDNLQDIWHSLCVNHDVTSDLPSIGTLFAGADPALPSAAAQVVLVNMLSEIIEGTSRFSPWYKRPASAFGIVPEPQCDQRARWVLTSAALQQYAAPLDRLAAAIEDNLGIILATRFVDDLDHVPEVSTPCRLAACRCTPPRTILVHDVVIASAEIICDACQQPFSLAGNAPNVHL